MKRWVTLACAVALVQAASAGVVISEWMYSGTDGEFVEFTNVGPDAVDMTNWSYSDTDATPGDMSFADVFGLVQPGESVILTDVDAAAFRTAWGLAASVKVFGPNSNSNLGRSDMINLYDASGALIGPLTYNDQAGQGPRTQNKSCNIPAADYGEALALSTWVLASVGEAYGAWAASGGDLARPGIGPEPVTVLLALGGAALFLRRR